MLRICVDQRQHTGDRILSGGHVLHERPMDRGPSHHHRRVEQGNDGRKQRAVALREIDRVVRHVLEHISRQAHSDEPLLI